MTLPRVQPIIPTSRKQPFDDPGWLFEFKYDGFRALCYLEAGRCLLVSRNGNHLARFDELGAELGGLLDLDEAILDGEVIAADATGRPQFYELLRRTRAPAYVAFDILWADGTDLRALPLSKRRQRLTALCQKDQRSCPRLCRSRAEDASSSIWCGPRSRRDCRQAPQRSVRAAHEMAEDQEPGLHAEGR